MFSELKVGLFRLRLVVRQPMILPPYKGSVLRGGFGSAFRRIACPERASTCAGCLVREVCPYSYVFETSPPGTTDALRTLKDIPRPFVIEPPMDELTQFQPGDTLRFGLVLIGKAVDYLPYFVAAWRELGRTGIGPRRAGFELLEVRRARPSVAPVGAWTPTEEVVFTGGEKPGPVLLGHRSENAVNRSDLEVLAQGLPSDRLTVDFLTMTRLKTAGTLTERPTFGALIRALLRRASSLAYFHHGVRLELDYKGLSAAADKIETIRDGTRWSNWSRYSNRQGARMDLGGFVGEVTFGGDIASFRDLLALGSLVHAGKNTTFGLGKFVVKPG